jgi:hypothetical protein
MLKKKKFERVPLDSLKHLVTDRPANPAPPLRKSRSTKSRTTPPARSLAAAKREVIYVG